MLERRLAVDFDSEMWETKFPRECSTALTRKPRQCCTACPSRVLSPQAGRKEPLCFLLKWRLTSPSQQLMTFSKVAFRLDKVQYHFISPVLTTPAAESTLSEDRRSAGLPLGRVFASWGIAVVWQQNISPIRVRMQNRPRLVLDLFPSASLPWWTRPRNTLRPILSALHHNRTTAIQGTSSARRHSSEPRLVT